MPKHLIPILTLCLLITPSAWATKPTAPKQVAVASAHPLATQAGIEILQNGGNAFDAAITVAAVLGVAEPYSAGIGGGGFWMLHHAKSGKTLMVDAREMAPGAAHRDMYLGQDGEVDRDKAINSALSAGIPGQPAAFAHIAEKYGQLPLTTSLAPAIALAQEGFTVNPVYLRLVEFRKDVLNRFPESKKIFLLDGKLNADSVIKQADLANTLTALANEGFDGFYKGPIAKKLAKEAKANGGIWTESDLANYKIIEREPIRFDYHGATIWSAPPPSSGGVALAQMFGMLSNFNLSLYNEADKTHLLVEVMRRAYRDRAEYLGD
ncbi:MAG: gamma-glutamyltransferase, partial [Pseudomonadales bacterium]|nr:gamma-glutamyltransferase [Pseudomonadales bacterium]